MLALCFLVTVICALDRAAMSVAVLPMAAQYAYTDGDKGLIGSAYFWGYTVMNLVGGTLCIVMSPQLLLALGVVLWSAFTALTPSAAAVSLPTLLACRALMGVAEGVCLPCIQALIVEWVPQEQKSRAVALTTSGITVGTVAALFLVPQVVAGHGWPSVFSIFAAFGFAWCAAWLCVPSRCPVGSEKSEADPVTGLSISEVASSIPWGQMAASTQLRGVVACAMAQDCSICLIFAWLPSYFATTYGLVLSDAAVVAAPPWVCYFVVANAAGIAADALAAGGTPLGQVRRGFQAVGSAGPALCLVRLAAGHMSEGEAVEWFCATLGLAACFVVGCNAAPSDMARRHTPVLYGLMNGMGCLAGSITVWLTGVALDKSPEVGFSMVFGTAAAIYLAGAVAFQISYRGEREFA